MRVQGDDYYTDSEPVVFEYLRLVGVVVAAVAIVAVAWLAVWVTVWYAAWTTGGTI